MTPRVLPQQTSYSLCRLPRNTDDATLALPAQTARHGPARPCAPPVPRCLHLGVPAQQTSVTARSRAPAQGVVPVVPWAAEPTAGAARVVRAARQVGAVQPPGTARARCTPLPVSRAQKRHFDAAGAAGQGLGCSRSVQHPAPHHRCRPRRCPAPAGPASAAPRPARPGCCHPQRALQPEARSNGQSRRALLISTSEERQSFVFEATPSRPYRPTNLVLVCSPRHQSNSSETRGTHPGSEGTRESFPWNAADSASLVRH